MIRLEFSSYTTRRPPFLGRLGRGLRPPFGLRGPLVKSRQHLIITGQRWKKDFLMV